MYMYWVNVSILKYAVSILYILSFPITQKRGCPKTASFLYKGCEAAWKASKQFVCLPTDEKNRMNGDFLIGRANFTMSSR